MYIGRPFLYGLGAGGKAGVTRCLEIIRKELDITMAFCGHRDIRDVDERILWHPATARAAAIAGRATRENCLSLILDINRLAQPLEQSAHTGQ